MTVPCDHCEQAPGVHPVIIAGVQSYLGHLLTGKMERRRAWLCAVCYVNLRATNIQGLTVEDDQEVLAALANPRPVLDD